MNLRKVFFFLVLVHEKKISLFLSFGMLRNDGFKTITNTKLLAEKSGDGGTGIIKGVTKG